MHKDEENVAAVRNRPLICSSLSSYLEPKSLIEIFNLESLRNFAGGGGREQGAQIIRLAGGPKISFAVIV